jgi:hypothetical protein
MMLPYAAALGQIFLKRRGYASYTLRNSIDVWMNFGAVAIADGFLALFDFYQLRNR